MTLTRLYAINKMSALALKGNSFYRKMIEACLNTQEARNESVRWEPLLLVYVPNRFKILEMCQRAVQDEAEALEYIPDHFKNKRMCVGPLKMNQTP